jgi:hypothetical protein
MSEKPICDCRYWGENVFPFFDDGCHVGYDYCDPSKCPDYTPLKRKTKQ